MTTKKATFAQYEALAKRIHRLWGGTAMWGGTRPVAVRDWGGDGDHAVVWEEGPYNWTMLLDGGRDEEFGMQWKAIPAPKGYFLEPITHYAVGIYPI
jgi:hypothetical protein